LPIWGERRADPGHIEAEELIGASRIAVLDIGMGKIQSYDVTVIALVGRGIVVVPLHVVVGAIKEQADVGYMVAARLGAFLVEQAGRPVVDQVVLLVWREPAVISGRRILRVDTWGLDGLTH
jgi:hypothetical protein